MEEFVVGFKLNHRFNHLIAGNFTIEGTGVALILGAVMTDHLSFIFPELFMTLAGLKGIVQKCTFCADRLREGGVPAYVEVCPTNCRVFGDLNDPESEISRIVKQEPCLKILEQAKTDPSTYYVR